MMAYFNKSRGNCHCVAREVQTAMERLWPGTWLGTWGGSELEMVHTLCT